MKREKIMAKEIEAVDETKIIHVPLKDIFADPTWNVRSNVGERTGDESEDDENTDAGLQASIEAKGQDEPVTLRPSPKGTKEPYTLVAGFRRLWAMHRIAEKTGEKAQTIKAVVKNLSEAEARAFNIRENTARDSLGAADLNFGVERILELEPNKTGVSIANELGMAQGYISKHVKLVTALKPSIRRKWREMVGFKPTVDQMTAIAKLDKTEQDAKFQELVDAKRAREEGGSTNSENAWRERAKDKAAKFGTLMGTLARAGFIELDAGTFFYDALEHYVTLKKNKDGSDPADRVKAAIAEAGVTAFMAELERDDDTTGETAEEVKAKEKGKKSKGAKNGAVAQA